MNTVVVVHRRARILVLWRARGNGDGSHESCSDCRTSWCIRFIDLIVLNRNNSNHNKNNNNNNASFCCGVIWTAQRMRVQISMLLFFLNYIIIHIY